MAEVRAPERFRPALLRLAQMPPDAVSELVELLTSNTEFLNSKAKARDRADALKLTPPADGFQLIEAVIPLMYWQASTGQSTNAICTSIAAQLQSEGPDRLNPDLVEPFRNNLTAILNISSVALKAKALSIAADSPRMYTISKILSDLRPVFGDDVSKKPVGAVVLHQLRISFNENHQEREFFVEMDSRDLRELQQMVVRALQKDAALRQFIQDSNLQLFDPSE
jgi:hypothetical protein